MTIHFGRSFVGSKLEEICPCPQEACGLIDEEKVVPECPEHPWGRIKTIRQMHKAEDCPQKS